jgi:hypothetical protein
MKYIVFIVLAFFLMPNNYLMASEDGVYCDYYDDMGDFLLTFDSKILLGQSGESRTSGINFTFSEDETLLIYSLPSIYNINEVCNDLYDFTEKYLTKGCTEENRNNFKKITCHNGEYSLIVTKYEKNLFCTYIIYNTTNWHHKEIYKDIINSMLFFKQNDLINNNARAIVALAGWQNYNKYSPYEQPRLFCGKNQIRQDLIRILIPSPAPPPTRNPE